VEARRLGSSRFVRNVAAVVTGVAAAQAISLAFTPLLTRLYGPEAFGAAAAFIAVLNISTPLSTLGFASAIVMPADEEGAMAVARLSLVCAAIVAVLVLAFVWALQRELATWTGLEAHPGFLYLLPMWLMLAAVLAVANQVAIREGLFKAKAGAYVASTLLMNIIKLAGGFLAPSGLVLIAVTLGGTALNGAMLLARVPKQGAFQIAQWLGTAGVWRAAREQRDFVVYRLPQNLINTASLGLPVILLTGLFGAATAGQYSIATLILGAPIVLLGQSFTEVFFPKITDTIRNDPSAAGHVLRRATSVMTVLAVIPFGFVAVAGDVIFPFVLGSQWVRAGEFSQWVAIWMASVLATRPAVAAMPVLRLQGTLLVYEVIVSVARVLSLYVGARTGNDLVAVAAFAMVNVAGYMSLLLLILVRASQHQRDPA
jgi:O-antigen/teichoic acid export membrane protein